MRAQPNLISIWLIASLCLVSVSRADIPARVLSGIDAEIARLESVVGGYPPNVEGARNSAKVKRRIKAVIGSLERSATKYGDSWSVELRIGECYRMGHNLDM